MRPSPDPRTPAGPATARRSPSLAWGLAVVLPVVLWCILAAYTVWWTVENPLPDGFQNEYLHVGNAYDLWGALLDFDVWHLRWYMYTGYWPWGFYAAPWPFLAVIGPGRLALVAGNLLHLVALLWGATRLGQRLQAPLAPLLLVLCPGVFGSLVRFEPNLATIAWTVAGVACLVESSGLRRAGWVMGWGTCLGLGLMFDRLTVGFFLVPAVLPLLWGAGRRQVVHLLQGGGFALFLTAAYYREFFMRHTDELLGQAPVGEIDAAGQVTVTGGSVPAAYYPLSLLDSQAGLLIGILMLSGLVMGGLAVAKTGRRSAGATALRDPRTVLLASVLPAVLLFTLIAKKQVFYTLPILGPLAVLAATHRRLAPIAVVGGLYSFVGLGLGWSLPGLPPGPILPDAWVSPRHTLAHPPSHERFPFDEALALLHDGSPGAVLVMSEDHRLFEGYLALALREGLGDTAVRGVITDPNGTYELMAEQDAFVWVGPAGDGWPSRGDIEAELLADHYNLSELPPVAESVVAAQEAFDEVGRLPAGTDVELVVFVRKPDPTPEMR